MAERETAIIPACKIRHVRARDIRRHQIGGELNAAKGKVKHLGKGLYQFGFSQPGIAFQKQVAAGVKGHKREPGNLVDPEHFFLHAAQKGPGEFLNCLIQGVFLLCLVSGSRDRTQLGRC